MRASKGVAQHRVWLGAAALGTFVFGLALAGADAPKPTTSQTDTKAAGPAAGSLIGPQSRVIRQTAVAGQMPEGDFPIVATYMVDYRDDDMTRARNAGTLVGPLPHAGGGNVAGGACSFDIECDDGNKCTDDNCNIAPGAPVGSGICEHPTTPDGQPGDCDDGNFCNGPDVCVSGACVSGPAATCCSDPTAQTLCQPGFARCSPDSENADVPCTKDSDCRSGRCERCYDKCTTDAQCDDGLNCNGKETCNTGSGLCLRGAPPCGVNADCDEGRCRGGANNNRGCTLDSGCPGGNCSRKVCSGNPALACNVDTDCVTADRPCVDLGGPVCYVGRCCDTNAEPGCSKRPLVGHCDGGANAGKHCKSNTDCPSGTCVSTAGGPAPAPCPSTSFWFAGDDGREALPPPTSQVAVAGCGGGPADLSEEYGCPKYTSGLTQQTAAAPPSYPLVVGPISDGSVTVPMAGGPLNALGDDYFISNGSHIGLDVFRFVGAAITNDTRRILVEFYDANGNFVEDIVLGGQPTTDVGVIVVEFEPELTIPASGYVVVRVASHFSPDTKIVWLSTTAASLGTNDTNKLWKNSGPTTNFLSPNPGVLAFELVGDKVPGPSGACCDPTSGECEDNVAPWVCAGRLDNYNGDGSTCAACAAGIAAGKACRRCSTTCTADTACNLAGVCTSGTCTAGLIGSACTTNANCNYVGTCFGVCAGGGAVNQPCSSNADCPSSTCNKAAGRCGCDRDEDCSAGGCNPLNTVCPSSTCAASSVCGNGACCNPTLGSCSVVPGPGSCTGVWQGFGSDCDADNGLDAAEQHCCDQPFLSICNGGTNAGLRCYVGGDCPGGTCTNQICSGGPNNLDPCTSNAQCRFCVGGTNNGNTCTTNANCPSGQCLGTCGTRYTGADNIQDAYVHVLSVPSESDPPLTITITGNNNGATSTAENPDACFGPLPNPNNEPGWFEHFTVNACAWVRIDHCCTSPVHEPAWAFMSTDTTCNVLIGNSPNPYHFGESANRRGEPYCKNGDDNLWQYYGPLAAGVDYYLPIYSGLAGHHGEYQVHITVEPCPVAACCKGDGTCAVLDQVGCDAAAGLYLGPPQVATTQPFCEQNRCVGGSNASQSCITNADCPGSTCASNPNGACVTGSCCTDPGVCKDNDTLGHSMTELICDSVGFEGSFIGGTKCRGGSCPSAPSESCSSTVACAPTVSTCVTNAQADAQPNPCPVCEFLRDGTRCNDEGGRFVWVSDSSDTPGQSPTRQANDIMPTTTEQFTSVCVLGHYIGFYDNDNNGTYETRVDGCEDENGGVVDDFTVRLFAVDSLCQGGTANGNPCATNANCPGGGTCVEHQYLPGVLLGEWATSHAPDPRTQDTARNVPNWGTERFYDFQLFLIPSGPYPLITLQQGVTYFLEISDNTSGGDEECAFRMLDSGPGTGGNDYALLDPCSEEYTFDSIKLTSGDQIDAMSDPAWCLNVPFAAPPTPLRACCIGAPLNTCQVLSARDCAGQGGNWQLDQDTCSGFTCPHASNDLCSNAPFVREGVFSVDMYDVTQDGNPTEQCEGLNPTAMDGDVWYKYQPSQSGQVYFGTCDCEHGGNEVVAVYNNTLSPTICPCPGDAGMTLQQCRNSRQASFVHALGCQEFGDAGEVVMNVTAGNCYTVRVAMFDAAAPSKPVLKIVQNPFVCGDNVRNILGGEQCDGTDDALCDGKCNYACQCPEPACGNSVHEAGLGEECDTTSGSALPCSPGLCIAPGQPGECTCIPLCGNNHREGAELCDGSDLGICGGAGCNNLTCRCNATCGNGVADIGEQCDGPDDDLCPTRCIPNSDPNPALRCTCPPATCGNGFVEAILNNEECDGADSGVHGQCDEADCRLPGDPGGECTCACLAGGTPPFVINWNSDPLSSLRATRTITFSATVATASGGEPSNAIQVRMVDLQNPVPPNPLCCPPQNFSAYEAATCTAVGETGGCNRWLGPVQTFYESSGNPLLGNFRGSRLQCTPYYYDWTTEPLITIVGAEVVPSSTYEIRSYGSACKGSEASCAAVGPAVTVLTRRSGDIASAYNPPATTPQPDAVDVASAVNKFQNKPGAPSKRSAQIQGNSADPNNDIDAIDIVGVVDAFRGLRFAYSGPCSCPSTVTCNATACTSAAQCPGGGCFKTCVGGTNIGLLCTNNTSCPGGTCGTGFCRDKCGRCN